MGVLARQCGNVRMDARARFHRATTCSHTTHASFSTQRTLVPHPSAPTASHLSITTMGAVAVVYPADARPSQEAALWSVSQCFQWTASTRVRRSTVRTEL